MMPYVEAGPTPAHYSSVTANPQASVQALARLFGSLFALQLAHVCMNVDSYI